VAGDVGAGHVFGADQAVGTGAGGVVVECGVRLAGPWGAEEDDSLDSCGEGVIEVLPALGRFHCLSPVVWGLLTQDETTVVSERLQLAEGIS
jgi:hypothetical protein